MEPFLIIISIIQLYISYELNTLQPSIVGHISCHTERKIMRSIQVIPSNELLTAIQGIVYALQ